MTAGGSRTHYQVLGVTRSASPETIRAAHRQLARVLHPDRQGEASAAERKLAERRMREVNAAWTVLSDPARRAEYDRSLGSGHRSGPRTPSGGSGAGSTHNTHNGRSGSTPGAELEDVFDPDEPELTAFQFHLLRRGPMVAILLVALLLFVMTAYAGNAARTSDDTASTTSQPSRDCVRIVDAGRTAVRTSCESASDGRIITAVRQPLDCPARTRYVVLDGELVCVTNDPTVVANNPPGG